MIFYRKKHRFMTYIVVSALACSQITRTDGWFDAAVAFGSIAAAAAVGGAICYACSESDADVARAAERQFADAKKYMPPVDAFSARYHITTPHLDVRSLAVSEEHDLAPLAVQVVHMKLTMQGYLASMWSVVSNLQSSYTKLKKRIRKLEDKRGYLDQDEQRVLRSMRAIFADIEDFLPYLELYYKFLYEHRAYFALYEYESQLYTTYKVEIENKHRYAYDAVSLAHALRQCVGLHNTYGTYPYLAYKKQLDGHISSLQARIHDVRYTYTQRLTAAKQLEDYLIKVRGIIIADSAYQRELDQKRRDKQHQEEMNVMRERVRAEERRARAEEERAQAEYEKARAQREANRIARQQNGDVHSNNKTEVRVYL